MSNKPLWTRLSQALLLAALLALPFQGGEAQATEAIELTLQTPEYQIQTLPGGQTDLWVEDWGRDNTPGQPRLPHQVLEVGLPPDVDWDSLRLEVGEPAAVSLPGSYRIPVAEVYKTCSGEGFCPAEQPGLTPGVVAQEAVALEMMAPRIAAPELGALAPTTVALAAEKPVEIARIAAVGQLRKWHIAQVEYSPFRYDPATGALQVVERVNIRLLYRRSAQKAPSALLQDTVMDDLAAETLVNYTQARGWYESALSPDAPDNVLTDYVIITTNAIVSSSTNLQNFITHKNARGHHVLVVTESNFNSLSGPPPNLREEKVRKWLQNNYLSLGIKYVLLIGGPVPGTSSSTDLPMKMTWPLFLESTDREAPSDYYYAELTGDWDVDDDQYYGEYQDDWVPGGLDLFPEVYVGRIPFYGSYTDLDHILQKTIDYQDQTDIAWRRSALLPMSFMGDGVDGAEFGEALRNGILNPAGFTSWRIYQQGDSKCGLDSIYDSEEHLRAGWVVHDRWNAGNYGIFAVLAHGYTVWASVGYPIDATSDCWDGELLRSDQTADLDDVHPALVYLAGCGMAYPEEPDNFTYALLRHGGIATVGSTRVSFQGGGIGGDWNHGDGDAAIGYVYVKRLVDGLSAGEALYQARYISAMHAGASSGLMNALNTSLYGDPEVGLFDYSRNLYQYLSIPGAAFQPKQDGYDYQNHGRYLLNYTTGVGTNTYVAPVSLPDGAVIERLVFQWSDRDVEWDGAARLKRTDRNGSIQTLASVLSYAEAGYGATTDFSVSPAAIDNLNYSYWVEWELPADAWIISGCNVIIEYTAPLHPTTGHLSLAAAAFRPFESGYDYEIAGPWLVHWGGPEARGWYVAPVQLPNGATVTKMTFYYYDDDPGRTILARLQRGDLLGNYWEMAYAESSGAPNWGNAADTSIASAVIDNVNQSYWITMDGPNYLGSGGDVSGIAVLIDYTLDTSYPTMGNGLISLSAAAFTPFADEQQYEDHGRYLIHQGPASPATAHYEAPLYLPQGYQLKKFTFWYFDDSPTKSAQAYLCRTDTAGAYSCSATITSSGSGGYGHQTVTLSEDTYVDNSQYGYWVFWILPISGGAGDRAWGVGVTLEAVKYYVWLPAVKYLYGIPCPPFGCPPGQ